jgi:hypothetical protein
MTPPGRFANKAFSAGSYFLRILMITKQAQMSQCEYLRLLMIAGETMEGRSKGDAQC